jgi:hypothetical protein
VSLRLSQRVCSGCDTGSGTGALFVKKGRHRRFEEARALKRNNDLDMDAVLDARDSEPCPECDAAPGHDHASWCLYEAPEHEEL